MQQKKVIENNTIGYTGGTFGGKTWRGECSIPVAVKAIKNKQNLPLAFAIDHFIEELNHVIDVLDESYLVKQHGIRTDGCSSIYQAMEIMDENLEVFVTKQVPVNGRVPDCLIVVLRDLVDMVKVLHDHDIRCKNLKPSNIFVQNERAKLDPGAATSIQADNPWLAPEERIKEEDERLAEVETSGSQADMYRIGMLIYYCLTKGKTISHMPSVLHLESILPAANYEAIPLIRSLLSDDFEKRPSAKEVLRHLFFWLSQKRLEFIEVVSDLCEIDEDFRDTVNLITFPFVDSWATKIDKSLIDEMDYYAKNNNEGKKPKSPSSCLRLIWNLKDHVASMSDATTGILMGYASGMHRLDTYSAKIMYGIDSYFAAKFPTFLFRVWTSVAGYDYHKDKLSCYY